jgi:hypothetical protein
MHAAWTNQITDFQFKKPPASRLHDRRLLRVVGFKKWGKNNIFHFAFSHLRRTLPFPLLPCKDYVIGGETNTGPTAQ